MKLLTWSSRGRALSDMARSCSAPPKSSVLSGLAGMRRSLQAVRQCAGRRPAPAGRIVGAAPCLDSSLCHLGLAPDGARPSGVPHEGARHAVAAAAPLAHLEPVDLDDLDAGRPVV